MTERLSLSTDQRNTNQRIKNRVLKIAIPFFAFVGAVEASEPEKKPDNYAEFCSTSSEINNGKVETNIWRLVKVKVIKERQLIIFTQTQPESTTVFNILIDPPTKYAWPTQDGQVAIYHMDNKSVSDYLKSAKKPNEDCSPWDPDYTFFDPPKIKLNE